MLPKSNNPCGWAKPCLLVVKLFGLVLGFAGEVDPQAAEVSSSTWERITVEWTSQPRSLGSCCMASSAVGLVAAEMDSATRISSVWSRGFTLPRWVVFSFWMGSMTMGEIKWMSFWMPPRAFRALSRAAELAPSRAEVLPVTMRPSGSWMAAAGRPVSSARSMAGPMTARSSG